MRNHQSRPTRSESFLDQYHDFYSHNSPNSQKMKASLHHQKWNNTEVKQENGKCLQDKLPKNHENKCYRCSMKGHWSHTCRTPKHLVDFYQTSIKEKKVEMNNYVPRRYIIFLILLYNQKSYNIIIHNPKL